MMTTQPEITDRRVNPQKFAMWTAIGSIIMMFAGFTSGYIVRKAQGNWVSFQLPPIFYVSTAVMLFSSLTMWLSLKTFKQRKMRMHERYVVLTVVLGFSFAVLQYLGFKQMLGSIPWNNNISLQYIIVIIGVHAAHILGGVIVLLIMLLRTFNRHRKTYSSTGLEIFGTFWHFVDILWIYLFVFFIVTS